MYVIFLQTENNRNHRLKLYTICRKITVFNQGFGTLSIECKKEEKKEQTNQQTKPN